MSGEQELARRSASVLLFGLLWLAAISVVAVPVLMTATAPALAQEQQRARRGGLLDLFFGRRDRVEQPEVAPRATRSRPRAARSTGGASSAPAAPAEPRISVAEKLENARTVLVVGDFMAGGLAEGLEEAFAEAPGIRIVSRANGSSGFVRDDYYNWPAQIGGILEEEKPAAVLVMIGSNDRQQLNVEGNRERVRSEAWLKEYEARATALAQAVKQGGVPLLWVGMPAFKVSSMSADMVAFNDIYRTVAEGVGGEFVDIWDGFVDENGAFASIGPDINGQRVRLRGSDGINLTKAGKRKIAFYAERPLNRLLGAAAAPGVATVGSGGMPSPLGQEPGEIDRTPAIALSDPELDGASELLGAETIAHRRKPGMPVELLVRDGLTPEGRPGRADDFSSAPAIVAPAATPTSVETTATIPD